MFKNKMCFRVGGNFQQGVPGGGIDDMVQNLDPSLLCRQIFRCMTIVRYRTIYRTMVRKPKAKSVTWSNIEMELLVLELLWKAKFLILPEKVQRLYEFFLKKNHENGDLGSPILVRKDNFMKYLTIITIYKIVSVFLKESEFNNKRISTLLISM